MSDQFLPQVSLDMSLHQEAYRVYFSGGNLLLDKELQSLPREKFKDELGNGSLIMGTLKGLPLLASWFAGDIPGEYQGRELVSTFTILHPEEYKAASFAYQVLNWEKGSKYCGECAGLMERLPAERGKKCPVCGRLEFPRISPAVIMAVVKGDSILLARGRNYIYSFFTVLAGYVEPGESLEECVAREVFEEVGIRVKNIRYAASQPWARSGALMLGFMADYASGEIQIDEKEIAEAGWFKADNLPHVPGKVSIARALIDCFLENCGHGA